jgi:hypothetical protein
MADHFRLLMNFLGHEMAVVALVDQQHRGLRFDGRALREFAAAVVNFGAGARHDHPIAVFQIADLVGERRQRDRVRADIHRPIAETDGKRRALTRADQEIVFAGEQKRQREGAAKPQQRRLHGVDRRRAAL